MKVDFWFTENQNEDVRFGVRTKSHLFSKESKYQRIDIFDTDFFGRIMTLDGCFMVTEKDEFTYQEMISHPGICFHPDPKSVLIIGGGDGGVAREVLKFNVEKVDLVEIDDEVIEASKTYLPTLSSSFDDSRLRVYCQDAFEFVDNAGKYDLVLVDSTDPIGFAASLFSDTFYMKAKNMLGGGGILVTQSGSPFMNPEFIKKAYRGASRYFKYVKPYLSFVPSYPSGMWSYVIATDLPLEKRRDFPGSYFNAEICDSLFGLPQFVKELLKED